MKNYRLLSPFFLITHIILPILVNAQVYINTLKIHDYNNTLNIIDNEQVICDPDKQIIEPFVQATLSINIYNQSQQDLFIKSFTYKIKDIQGITKYQSSRIAPYGNLLIKSNTNNTITALLLGLQNNQKVFYDKKLGPTILPNNLYKLNIKVLYRETYKGKKRRRKRIKTLFELANINNCQ